MEQVKLENCYLGIGQEQGIDVPLCQVGADRCIIGKIAIMDECLVHPNEWVGTAGMPDFPFRRIAMMPDPNVGVEIFQPVIANHIIAVADHLEHEQVFPVRQHESPFVAG